MKIKQEKQKFAPITITIETEGELRDFFEILEEYPGENNVHTELYNYISRIE